MKLAVIFLCLLGIAAAACAAFLITGLNPTRAPARASTDKPEENPAVVVLYTLRGIPAMTVVDSGMVVSKSVPRAEAPLGYLASATDVVGKVASKSLAQGQPFTKDCFAEMTGPRLLAGVIPHGKRAVGISVSDYAGLEGLIYPGSTVDVMVSFKPDGLSQREAVTTTLIEKVQVLAFDQQTIVSPGRAVGDVEPGRSGSRRVTLLVDPHQSKALEVAMGQGTLSLALRNPLDSAVTDNEVVSVRSLMGEDLPTGVLMPAPEIGKAFATALQAAMTVLQGGDSNKSVPATQPTTQPVTPPGPTVAELPPPPSRWETMVIHGDQVESVYFEIPAAAGTPWAGLNTDKLSPDELARLRLATQPTGPTKALFRP